jgi:hypothetical protein
MVPTVQYNATRLRVETLVGPIFSMNTLKANAMLIDSQDWNCSYSYVT